MEKTYILHDAFEMDLPTYDFRSGKDMPHIRESRSASNFLTIDGRRFAYFLNSGRETSVMVPGEVIGETYRTGDNGCKQAVKVAPVQDPATREEITKRLGRYGDVCFW